MLGWMLKRGLDGGRDAMDGPDDTQIDQPDTPGPVFAARAFKSALFGTPAPPTEDGHNDSRRQQLADEKAEMVPSLKAKTTTASTTNAKDTTPPRRLAGILLTPGTGTTRRKRVSFGHDVEENKAENGQKDQNNPHPLKKEFKVDRNKRRNSLFGEPTRAASTSSSTGDRNRTRAKVADALENARKQSATAVKTTASASAVLTAQRQEQAQGQNPQQDSVPVRETAATTDHAGHTGEDGVWEEVEDDDDDAEWDPDVTVDLNEPHSQSGRFWKAQFQRYQEDAKVEMSRLLKYKQLAKSYAKMKDAEAVDMQAKLREEKHKVVQMEGRITELAGQIARKRMKGTDRDYQDLISDLTRQTALAVQYRNQVKELEAMLQDDDNDDNTMEEDNSVLAFRSGRLRHQAAGVSPRTQHTLHETQRELRRAREQVRELTQAKDDARRLRTALRAAEKRAFQSESEAKGLRADLAAASAAAEAATAQAQDHAKRAQFAEDERRRKDDELRRLQRKYDTLKDDAKARVGEAEQVLRRKNEEISQWKKAASRKTEADADVVDAAAKTRSSEDNLKAKTALPSAPPSGLAALEKLTRTRYEALSRRKQSSTTGRAVHEGVSGAATRSSNNHEGTNVDDDFAIGLGNVRFDSEDEPAPAPEHDPPQQKRLSHHRTAAQRRQTTALGSCTTTSRHAAGLSNNRPRSTAWLAPPPSHEDKEEADAPGAFRILEDDDVSTSHVALPPAVQKQQRRTTSTAAAAAAAAEPLCPIVDPQQWKKNTTTSAVAAAAAVAAEAMDVSRCSLASERAAAAVARIEKRRAERKQKLDQLRNKENMQPA